MLFIFDKDGTLVRNAVNPQKPPNKTEEQEVLPNVLEKLAELREQGYKIAVCSNQGGVAWGFITPQEARSLMDDCDKKIGGSDFSTFCPYDSRAKGKPNAHPIYSNEPILEKIMRKPAPGMLLDAMWVLGFKPEDTIFVGDQDSDQQAAENADVKFIWAKDFFTQI